MGNSQKRAIQNYRSRLSERGLASLEAVSRIIADEPPRKGGILAALRRSPLVGTDLNLDRSREKGHRVKI